MPPKDKSEMFLTKLAHSLAVKPKTNKGKNLDIYEESSVHIWEVNWGRRKLDS